MTKSITFLKELLPFIESYMESKDQEDINIESFTLWLNQRMIKSTHEIPREEMNHSQNHLNFQLLHVILFLNRFAKVYLKKALTDSPLASVEDFLFLAILGHKESMRKSELIYYHVLEMPTGIEVINRLLNKGLIEDFADPEDGRSKRVKVTGEGKQLIKKMRTRILKVNQIIGGDLNAQQKIVLLSLFDQLSHFHLKIVKNEKTKSLDELCSMVNAGTIE